MTAEELKNLGYTFEITRHGCIVKLNGIEIYRKKRMSFDTRYPAMHVRQELKFWYDAAINVANKHLTDNPEQFYTFYGDW